MKTPNISQFFSWLPVLRSTLGDRDLWRAVIHSTPFTKPDTPRLHAEVQKLYMRVATDPDGEFHFHRGAEYAQKMLGYDGDELSALPLMSTESFAGVANPHVIDPLAVGEVVLDIGSGSGTDLLLAARKVGPSGRAIGIDMTEEMVARCRTSIRESGLDNVAIERADAENLPLADEMVDAVISNGVFNLIPNKERALHEIYRVLRPGGRFMLGDIALTTSLGRFMRGNVDLWALCVGGALQEAELVDLATRVGFERVRITHRFDCIQGTSGEVIARWLGVHGVNLCAVKSSPHP